MSVPISPLIPLLYYRGDLYKEAGLKAPETFAELEANAKKLHKPPGRYGIVQRGARGPATCPTTSILICYGFGGSIFKNQAAGDYSVIAQQRGRPAPRCEYYLRIAKEAGHPQTASLDQAEVIQNMATGKAAHIMAWSRRGRRWTIPINRPSSTRSSSRRPRTRRDFPTASGLGHWLGGIAKNIPDDRKRGAVEFLRWFQTKEAQIANAKFGGIPVNAASYRDPISQERKFRWMKPLADSLPHAVNVYQFPEASEVIAILELGLNQAVAGNTAAAPALNEHGGPDPRRDDQIQLQHRQAATAALRTAMDGSVSASTARHPQPGVPIRRMARPTIRLWRWMTLSPALLMMLLLSVLPLVNLFLTSFYNVTWAGGRAIWTPAGLANYAALARDDLLQRRRSQHADLCGLCRRRPDAARLRAGAAVWPRDAVAGCCTGPSSSCRS